MGYCKIGKRKMGRLQEKERFPHDDGETWVVPFIFVSRNFCSMVDISKAQGFGFHHNHPLKRMEVDIFWIFGGGQGQRTMGFFDKSCTPKWDGSIGFVRGNSVLCLSLTFRPKDNI